MSSPKEVLHRLFVNSINENNEKIAKENKNKQSGGNSRINFSEFRTLVAEALQKTGAFTSSEVEAVDKELTSGIDTSDGDKFNLLSASEHTHELAKKLGLPNLSFVYELRAREIKKAQLESPLFRNSGETCSTPRRITNYSFALDASFYSLMLHSNPALRYDFNQSHHNRLTEEISRLPLPASNPNLSREKRTLDRIRANAISIARRLQTPVETESLLQYSKRSFFCERALPAKIVNLLTKKPNQKTFDQTALSSAQTPLAYNCHRCPPSIAFEKRKKFALDRSSPIPAQFQCCNVNRIECFSSQLEGFRHYFTCHLKRRGDLPSDPFNRCLLLVFCPLCVSEHLTSGKSSVTNDSDLTFCCLGCSRDHWTLRHRDSFFESLRRNLKDSESRSQVSQKFNDDVDRLFDVECRACLRICNSSQERLNHEKLCFFRYTLLTEAYSEQISQGYIQTPFLKRKRASLAKNFAKRQLVKLLATIEIIDSPTTNQPRTQEATLDGTPSRLRMSEQSDKNADEWRHLTRNRIQSFSKGLKEPQHQHPRGQRKGEREERNSRIHNFPDDDLDNWEDHGEESDHDTPPLTFSTNSSRNQKRKSARDSDEESISMKRRRRRGKASDRRAGRGRGIYRYQLGSEGDGVERFDEDENEDENEDRDQIESSEGETEEIEDQAGSNIEAEGESLGQIVDIQWCEERFDELEEEDCWTRTRNRRARYHPDSTI